MSESSRTRPFTSGSEPEITARSVWNRFGRSPGLGMASRLARRAWTRCALLSAVAVASSLLAPPLAAEEPTNDYSVTSWTIGNGLPQGTVNDMLQTDQGALWIATFGGLLRFDGVEFRTYDFDTLPNLPSVRITSLASDGAGGLWMLTQNGGVLHFRDGAIVESLAAPNSEQGDLSTISLLCTDRGELWLRGVSGRVWLHADNGWSMPVAATGASSACVAVFLDADGQVALATEKAVIRGGGPRSGGTEWTAPGRISCVGLAPNRLWVGLHDGLAVAESSTIERVRLDPPFESRVTALLEDGTGGVWVGTSQGLLHVVREVDGKGWVRGAGSGLLESFSVRSLLVDREGNLWVGSRGKGLARVSRKRVRVFVVARRDLTISAVASDGAEGAWLSFASGGVGHGAASKQADGTERLDWTLQTSPIAFSILHAFDGSLWSSGNKTLLRTLGGATQEFVLPGVLGALVETKSGDIWASVESGRRIVRLSHSGEILESLDIDGRVISLSADAVDGVWVGCDGAVIRHAAGRTERFGVEQGVPQGDVRCVLSEPDGSAWIATYAGGLARLKDGRATRITRAQGLPNMALSSIQDDGAGRLWLLSNQGLIVAERRDLLALVEGRAPRIDPVVIGPSAGMPEANFGSPAGFRDERGRLWFGTIEGPVRVDALAFPFNRVPPRVLVEGVSADDVELTMGGRVAVPPATKRLVFDFTTFSLTAPERVRFRYRLVGYDEDWVDAGTERSAPYTGLRPSQYEFRVEARNEDGVWSESAAVVGLRVAPSWWETNWFRTAVGFLFVACLYAIDRVRIGFLRRRTQVLLEATEGRARAEERESRLREQLAHVGRVATADELATSLAHEVNQPLAAIVTNAQAGRRYLANDVLDRKGIDDILRDIAQQGQRASDVIRRLRDFLRKNESERRPIDLNQIVRDTLPLVRRELQDHRIDLVLELAPRPITVDADPIQIQQVVVNLVNNACEALSNSNGERTIDIRTRAELDHVVFEMRDSGPGISPQVAERLFQPYVTTKSTGMGLGLAICRSIVEAHGGRIGVRSAAEEGTTFRIDLPATQERGVS